MSRRVLPGRSYPLGANVMGDGVNFSVMSKNSDQVELLLFDEGKYDAPAEVIPFDKTHNKTFYYWHMYVPGLKAGQVYAYRVHGPFEPQRGLRFDGSKVLIDPYSRAVVTENYDRGAAIEHGHDNCAQAMKSVVVDLDYNWEGDRPLTIPYSRTLIYEMHVRGFTKHESSGLSDDIRGTYLGVIEKIPYLKELGVTAVELLPVHQFDPQDRALTLETNYWGYSPIAFFAPHQQYAAGSDPLAPVREFREMVKALHKAGIEVILDVVYNHTAEGNEHGPTLCHRGFENRAYYILAQDPQYYMNFSGTGNSLNANQSITRRMIMDSLRYWVSEMHIDGFRFDLASVLSRDELGFPVASPPILWEIESDPILAGTKIIAEAWDADGLYQVGSFIGHRWAEWNGKYRDDVRKFVKGDPGMVSALASRILASPDIYPDPERVPERSINFVTAHDGFTLNDLVSYNEKHNEANGENNRDGGNDNHSWNCGWEGPTDDPNVERLRQKQIRNFMTILMLSQGTPMILMGDEVRRTQNGNNNGYGQDNLLSWFNWEDVERHGDFLRFTRGLINFVQEHRIFTLGEFWSSFDEDNRMLIEWHGVKLGHPDWSAGSRTLAFSLGRVENGEYLHIMLNAYWGDLEFELPPLPKGKVWSRIVDTAQEPPHDFCERGRHEIIDTSTYVVQSHSSVLLAMHDHGETEQKSNPSRSRRK